MGRWLDRTRLDPSWIMGVTPGDIHRLVLFIDMRGSPELPDPDVRVALEGGDPVPGVINVATWIAVGAGGGGR